MATRAFSLREGIMYIVVGGAVLFFAVFLGIRAGFAIRGDGGSGEPGELTPKNLPNRTVMKVGDPFPALQVRSLDSSSLRVADVIGDRPTVFAVVLPGCDPCENMLTNWRTNGVINDDNGVRIVLLAASQPNQMNLGPLEEFENDYPVYFVDMGQLNDQCGISTFPSVVGVKGDETIGFVANAYVHRLNTEFFKKYL